MNAAQTTASNEQTDPDYVPPLQNPSHTRMCLCPGKQLFEDLIDSDWTTLSTEQLPLPDEQLELLQAEQLAPLAEQQIADVGF